VREEARAAQEEELVVVERDHVAEVVDAAGALELGQARAQHVHEVAHRGEVHAHAVAHDRVEALVGEPREVRRVAHVRREAALMRQRRGHVGLEDALHVLDRETGQVAPDVLLHATRARYLEEDHALAAAHLHNLLRPLHEDLAHGLVDPLLNGRALVHNVGERVGVGRPVHRRVVDAIRDLELVGEVELRLRMVWQFSGEEHTN
jgi:hypothetical protein